MIGDPIMSFAHCRQNKPKSKTAESGLSEQQRYAVKQLRSHDGMRRCDLYGVGIRMPTVYSLIRRGLVRCDTETDGAGRTVYRYRAVG